jgi:ribonucleoside-diphosphate reductase alpha chain
MRNDQERTRPATGDDVPGTLAHEMLCRRYLLKDGLGKCVETSNRRPWRVASTVAGAAIWYGATRSQVRALARQFPKLMKSGRFLPNSPTLMNAKRNNGRLSDCFALGIDDSVEGIFEAVKRTVLVQKAGAVRSLLGRSPGA